MKINGKIYDLSQQAFDSLLSYIDVSMNGGWHEFYIKHGVGKSKTGRTSFHCFDSVAHNNGDRSASLSIMPETGQYRCHGCGMKGNAQSYFDSEIALRTPMKYIEYMVVYLHCEHILQDEEDKMLRAISDESQKLLEFIASRQTTEQQSSQTPLDIKEYKKNVTNLLESPLMLELLKNTRGMTESTIRNCLIGLTSDNKYITFPIFDTNSNLVNIKCYNPKMSYADSRTQKWYYPHHDRPVLPSPLSSLAGNEIYIMEGEPDCYAGISMGLNCITMGSASTSPDKFFEHFGDTHNIDAALKGKTVYIVLDDDEPGQKAALAMANRVYQYTKQVKIIDMGQREEFPEGLDRTKLKDPDDEKSKRSEKDFTDLVKKFGFGDRAREVFKHLCKEITQVWAPPTDDRGAKVFKVNLAEATNPRYYSHDGSVKVEFDGVVLDMNTTAFNYPSRIEFRCSMTDNPENAPKFCAAQCGICRYINKTGPISIDIKLVDGVGSRIVETGDFSRTAYVMPDDILSLIEVSRNEKNSEIKKIFKINMRCNAAMVTTLALSKIYKSSFCSDISERGADAKVMERHDVDDAVNSNSSDVTVVVYSMKQINEGKGYKCIAVQTSDIKTQSTVLLATTAEPIDTVIDMFKMNDDIAKSLARFKQGIDETVVEALYRKYDVYSKACGIYGRNDVFMAVDMVMMSHAGGMKLEFINSQRAWLELLMFGDPRCGKTTIPSFFVGHYNMGEFIGCGESSITATGIIGAIKTGSGGMQKISWGKLVTNHRGLLVMDEFHAMAPGIVKAMTPARSSGHVDIAKSNRARGVAHTRKIMIANPKAERPDDTASVMTSMARSSASGFEQAMDICNNEPQCLARFDMVVNILASDVLQERPQTSDTISNAFTALQAQDLLKWAYSRKISDFVFTDEAVGEISASSGRLRASYHPNLHIVNSEQEVKMTRMSMALACCLFSTAIDDYNKVLVTAEHVRAVENLLISFFNSPGMSMQKKSSYIHLANSLGDTEFLRYALKYVNVDALIGSAQKIPRDNLLAHFSDYIGHVSGALCYIPEANSEENTVTGVPTYDVERRLLSLLVTRNFVQQTRGGYVLTSQLKEWLEKFMEIPAHERYSTYLDADRVKSKNSTDISTREY